MPILILSGLGGRDAGREPFSFESSVELNAARVGFAFRSYLRPVSVVPFGFASLARLRSSRQPVRLTSHVGLRPAGSEQAGMPVQVIAGTAPLAWTVGCELGQALKSSYQHTGESESITLTVQVEPNRIGATLPVYASLGDAPALARELTVDTRQYEVTRTREGGITTVIRAYNAAAERARSFPLPELVDWVRSPRLDYPQDYVLQPGAALSARPPSLPPLRTVGVSDLVRRGFAAAGIAFGLIGPDPFEGETWKERRRDTSTGGRTPADLFRDTYGALGYRLIVRGSALFGVPPGGSLGGGGETFTRCEVESLTERGEAAQVPTSIRVTAAERTVLGPEVMPDTDPDKPGPPDPDTQSEQDIKDSWKETTPTENGFTVNAGFVWNGLLRQEQQVEIGRVTVMETVDGEAVTRTFERVLISSTKTTYQYHPVCPEAVTRQETTKRGYGYALDTETQMGSATGTLFSATLPAGDLVENQTEIITQTWHETGELAGFLRSRRTEGKRLVSLDQQNAEAEAGEVEEDARRGPLLAREYVAQVLGELYRRVGKLWYRHYGTTGGATVPLYDLDSQEAVRLTVRTGALQSGSEIMRNEPPRVTWPQAAADPENPEQPSALGPVRNEISLPQQAAFAVSGGSGAALTRSFAMLETASKLPSFAGLMAHAAGPRVVQDARLSVPRGLLPGSLLGSPVPGTVESLSIETEGKKGSANVTAVQTTAPALSAIPWPPDNDRERGFVTAVQGTLVVVDIPGSGSRVASLLTGFTAPGIGAVVELRTNSGGVSVVVGGG